MTLRQALKSVKDLSNFIASTNGYDQDAIDALTDCDEGGRTDYEIWQNEDNGNTELITSDQNNDHAVILVPLDKYEDWKATR